jgi:hypothetical protein
MFTAWNIFNSQNSNKSNEWRSINTCFGQWRHETYWYQIIRTVLSVNSVIFEVLTAVTIKNAVVRDIKTQIVLHRKHFSSIEPSRLLCKTRGVHGDDYEECLFLGYKVPVRASQVTHCLSATEPSQLMLCKMWGLYSGDYEECLLLEYKNPVRISQETYYLSATEPSELSLCKIWGFSRL